MMHQYHLNYLEQLEAESIHVFREIAAQFEKPVLMFSGGKDSITLVHLAKKAFAPGKIPFPLLHIDTGHNFSEALEFRDQLAKQVNATLIVRKVVDTIRQKNLTEQKGNLPAATGCRLIHCLTPLRNLSLTPVSAADEGMKKKQGPKKEFFLSAMSLDNGTQNYSGLNYGIFIMAVFTKEKM
jgi:3'-phosphoadenosine 5'-phosphosulfate sulfotransferase (PAPS reductase)/FAD synthetase